MAGRNKGPHSLNPQQDISDGEDGHHSETMGGNRPNGRVYSPDYMAPPCYQPQNPHGPPQGHYQQPYTTRSNPHLTEPSDNPETNTDEHSEGHDQMDPPYYVQDLVKPRALSEGKQLPEDYRGMVLGGDPPPYRQPPNALPLRDSRFRSEYNSEAPGNLALPPSDYRQQYFSQTMGGVGGTNRRFSPLRLPLGGSQWRICSWRICAIAFLTLSLCLAATTIYLAASQVTDWQGTPHCSPDSSDLLDPPPPSHSHRLPPQQRPSARDSGNHGSQVAPLSFSGDFSHLLFPSMLTSFLAQEHRKRLNPDDIRSSSAPFHGFGKSRMMHGDMPDSFVTAIRVAPSILVSISTDIFKNTHHLFKPLSPRTFVTPIFYSSLSSKPKHGLRHTFVAPSIHTLPHYLGLKRRKRANSELKTQASSSELAAGGSTSFPREDEAPPSEEDENEKAIIHSNHSGKESSKHVILYTTSFMKTVMSEPVLNLPNVGKIVEENLHISKDEEKAFLPLEDINLYANDIVNSETEYKYPLSSSSEAMKGSGNIRGSSLQSFATLNAMHDQRFKSNEADESNNEKFISPSSNNDKYISSHLNLTRFSLNASKWSNFSEEENHWVKFDSNESQLVSKITLPSPDREQNSFSYFSLPNDLSSSLNKKINNGFTSSYTELVTNTKEEFSLNSLEEKGSTKYEPKKISPTPVLKPEYLQAHINLTYQEEDSSSGSAMSLKSNLSFVVGGSMSKLNQAIGDGHFGGKAPRYQELSSVNFPEERSRQTLKESYNLEVDAKGQDVSNRIREEGPPESEEKFKAAEAGHRESHLNLSSMKGSEGRGSSNNNNAKNIASGANLSSKIQSISSLNNSHSENKIEDNEYHDEVKQNTNSKTNDRSSMLNINKSQETYNGEDNSLLKQRINVISDESLNDDKNIIKINNYDTHTSTYGFTSSNFSTNKEGISDAILSSPVHVKISSITISNNYSSDVEQSSWVEKQESTEKGAKQSQQLLDRRHQTQNQYSKVSADGRSLLRSHTAPEANMRNSEKIFHEYSSSASRINEGRDIERKTAISASSVYLSSAVNLSEVLETDTLLQNTKNMILDQYPSSYEETFNSIFNSEIKSSAFSIISSLKITQDTVIFPSFSDYLEANVQVNTKDFRESTSNIDITNKNQYTSVFDGTLYISPKYESNDYSSITSLATFTTKATQTFQNLDLSSVFNGKIPLHNNSLNHIRNVTTSRTTHKIDLTDSFPVKSSEQLQSSTNEIKSNVATNLRKLYSSSLIENKNLLPETKIGKNKTDSYTNFVKKSSNEFNSEKTHHYDGLQSSLSTNISSIQTNTRLLNPPSSISTLRIMSEKTNIIQKPFETSEDIKSTHIKSTDIFSKSVKIIDNRKTTSATNEPDAFSNVSTSATPILGDNWFFRNNKTKESNGQNIISLEHKNVKTEGEGKSMHFEAEKINNAGEKFFEENEQEKTKLVEGNKNKDEIYNSSIVKDVETLTGTERKNEDERNKKENNLDNYDERKQTQNNIERSYTLTNKIAGNEKHLKNLYQEEVRKREGKGLIQGEEKINGEEDGNLGREKSNEKGRKKGEIERGYENEKTIEVSGNERDEKRSEEKIGSVGGWKGKQNERIEEGKRNEGKVSKEDEKEKEEEPRWEEKVGQRSPSSLRAPFDQHSGSKREPPSWDYNKATMQVNVGMETTRGDRPEDDLPRSYVPIFQLENHHFPDTDIYSDQSKHQKETSQWSVRQSGTNLSQTSIANKNFSLINKQNSSSLLSFEKEDNEKNRSVLQTPEEINNDKFSNTNKNDNYKRVMNGVANSERTFHEFYERSEKSKIKEVDDQQINVSTMNGSHIDIIAKNQNETNSICSCDCPCKDKQIQFPSNQSISKKDADKEISSRDIGIALTTANTSHSVSEASSTPIPVAVEIKTHHHANNTMPIHKHRHHHGEESAIGKEQDSGSGVSKSKTGNEKENNQQLQPTTQIPAENKKSISGKQKKRNNSNKHRKGKKQGRKGQWKTCPPTGDECSLEGITSFYLTNFDPKKSFSHFYVVPILFGNEINSTSWHWKLARNDSNEILSPELQETVNVTGSSSMRRPHQIAPPDGASFSVLILGESLKFLIPPYGYWNLHLTLSDTTELHLALSIPRGTNLGLYARRNALPTHTQHDLMKVLRGNTPREARSTGGVVEVALEEVLESGDWFLSLYNDDGEPHTIGLLATPGSGSGECPQRCNGRGLCFLGRCQCQTGYSGHDCSEVLCPILCSGKGEYVEGQCQCHPGWKGKECELKIHECEVPDCSGHGRCLDGECKCANGFTGEFCEKVDCPNPTCSGHGWCVRGTCVCDRGWRRPDCSQMDTEALQCLPDCNKHGTFDINTHSCICNPPWTGSDCSKEACSLDCGPHGKCENDVCECGEGWSGIHCDERLCDSRCAEHGQCKNGTCVCMTGWNGRHCTLPGCPGNCMDHGKCLADEEGQWSCKCHEEWEGLDCSVRLETKCDDGIDNDNDGLKDCEDPECCETESCTKSQMCVSHSDPIDILLKMQPPASTASFYEKMQFIIQDNSLQNFPGSFNKRRAAVVRGRVVTSAGRPIVGLRVSTKKESDGMTMTRLDGMFDLMVNGGGAVTLRLGKSPFNPRELQVVVPWNEFVVLDDIVMRVEQKHGSYRQIADSIDQLGFNDTLQSSPCPQHDYDLLRPVIMSTWQNEFQGECPDVDAILVETQAVQESVQIPGTGLYLVYHSSRATGYKSTLRFQLTPERIPSSLRRVHLRIVLEGILYKKVFEADPLIKFTYSWDRNNIYKLRVYGTTVARISVGYEHAGCENTIIWDHHTTKVAGYDLAISEMGGFNLHVHHAYNFHQGILQKGDGRNIHLAGQRHLVTTLLGTGEQREVDCGARCEGDALKSPLLAPTCLAAAPDGSLYVGDFNLIRRVTPKGKVFTVARLNETRVSYRYHIAVSPVTGKVYVSDPDAHQVLQLETTTNVKDPSKNVIPIVGSGQRCLPGDRNKCGDGGSAIHARLTYPKGLAISPNDDLYIADGTNIRIVKNKVIRTVIGGHDHRSHWAPVPCNGTIERDQLRLRWPTELAISPLDGSLHILDDHLVLRLTPDNRVQVLTGRPLHCPAPSHNPQHMSRAALLLAPQSIAFSLQGDLYIAESDTQRINRVRVITTSGHISTFAGADSRCNCRDRSCFCHTFDNVSATSAIFSLISAIAVTPDNILHISDQAGYRVRSVRSILPEPNKQSEYEIFSPDTHEVYVFNRFGKHMETRNLVTGQTIYRFTYNTNANTGKLSSVTDAASNSFKVIRRTYSKKTFIENPQKQRVTIHFTIMNSDLEKLEAPDGYNITFRYHSASGLIRSKMEGGGRTYSYEYDDQGRLVRAVLPTGEVIALNFDLSIRGARVTATRDGENSVTAIIRGNTITHKTDSVEAISEPRGEGGLRLVTSWDHEISLERTSYRVLETRSPTSAQMFPILSRQQTHIGKELVNRYDWTFYPAEHIYRHDGMKVSADLRVNGEDLLTLGYDPVSSSEALLSVSGEVLVNITYDRIGRPTKWLPLKPLIPTTVSYDDWGHVTLWKRGELSEEYEYDHLLRLASVTYGDNTTIRYEFREQLTKPERVTYPSGRSYGLNYDEAGALRHVVTPKGSTYSLHLSTSLGFYRLRLALPSNAVVMQMRVDEQGRLVAITHPNEEGILLYEYDLLGRLRNELYGHGYTEYTYLESGLLRTARTRHANHDIRIDYRYRTGLAKEMKIRYGPKSNLHNVKFHYQYDESARLRVIEGEIESNAIPELYLKYDNLTGSLLAVSDLRIIRNNILETIIQNQKKYFVSTRMLDNYGRISEEVITLQGRTVYMMQLKYDLRGRITEQLNDISGGRVYTNYKYMADGQILEVTGGHTRLYTYDQNANIMSFTDETRAEYLHYDACDRVIKAGDGDVEYDAKGYVIRFYDQNFEYNTKGQLISGYARDKSWSFSFRYDHLDRVSVYRDHLGNVTQIIYGRPDQPHLISHLHNPKTHATTTLIYDDKNRLIALDNPQGRHYIATDQNGGPIAFFDDNGGLIRRQRWTPFGRLADSAGTPMWVGVGPWGGLLEPITGIIILKGYAYNPRIIQWMTPRWDKLTRATRQVTDVFVYRFRNNDPINHPEQLDYHFNDVSDWLRIMGIELNKVLGSEYQGYMLERPKSSIDVSALADSEVVSGLWCQYKASINHLQDLSFFSRSHIQRHVGAWKGAPISRQSYVFGPGVLVSNVNGRVLATYVPMIKDGSSVVGNVIRAVLNNSLILDVSSTQNGKDTFFFIKEGKKRATEDRDTLGRLSGIYNVTYVEAHDGLENHVSTPTANIIIFYNKRVEKARNRILAQLEVRAEEAAWAREAALVAAGRSGTKVWEPTEIEELISKGRVSGYITRHVHSSNKYPLLAADPSNILFKHESSRKRRKSRRKERKKGWRRRNKINLKKDKSELDT